VAEGKLGLMSEGQLALTYLENADALISGDLVVSLSFRTFISRLLSRLRLRLPDSSAPEGVPYNLLSNIEYS